MELATTSEMSGLAAAPPAAEAALIEASLGGDPEAFAELVRLHQHRVFRLVGRFFRRREDAEEMAQETFLTAWRRLSTYRGQAPFEHWLTRVCLNTCYERLRKSKIREEPLPDEGFLRARATDPDLALELARLLRRIPAKDRFLLLLLEGEGWSVAEIAARLGWTPVNVKVRAHRARRKLRRLLEQEG